jgi:gamma-glutamyltranspeptidase / glutathione hydrolase
MWGAIAGGHPLTVEAGARALAEGGNAVDACVAAAFVAFVTEGPLAGPAGGGFLLVHEPDGTPTLLDCFFAVPERTLGEMEEVVIDFADAGTQTFHVGSGSVAVPGLVHGLEEAHRRFGRLPWAALVAPAAVLAREGVLRDEARSFLHGILVPILQREEAGRRVYGDAARVVTVELEATLHQIGRDGAVAVASILPEFRDDLACYRVVAREPLVADVAGHRVFATPEPSRGGRVVLAVLEQLDAADDRGLPKTAQALADAYGASASGRLTGTTHISVVDEAGMAVGLSMTLGSGSGVFRGGSQLNNMLGELDVIGPQPRARGERLPSMMTPTLALAAGSPALVLGSAGSVRLAGAIAQVAWHVLAGVPLVEAIGAPRVHAEGGRVHVEGGWDAGAVARLAATGRWELVRWSDRNLFFGGVAAVARQRDGTWAAAGDPRRGGHGVCVEGRS